MGATSAFDSTDTDTGTIGDNATYTFAMTGAAASGQERIAILGGIGGPAASVDFDACTIDGQVATRVDSISRGADDGSNTCAFITAYRAPGTASTTFNVVATANCPGNNVFGGACAAWKLSDAGTLLAATRTSGNDPNLNTNTADSGTAIAAVFGYSDGTLTALWSGLTEVFDSVSLFGDTLFTGASKDIVTGSTPLSISADLAAGLVESVAAICVSFNGPSIVVATRIEFTGSFGRSGGRPHRRYPLAPRPSFGRFVIPTLAQRMRYEA